MQLEPIWEEALKYNLEPPTRTPMFEIEEPTSRRPLDVSAGWRNLMAACMLWQTFVITVVFFFGVYQYVSWKAAITEAVQKMDREFKKK